MNQTTMILALILTIAATIASFILVIPEKKRSGLNKFFQVLHDIFNFKQLFLEAILKALYVFMTFFCIFGGFFMLFGYSYEGWGGSYHINTFPQGLMLMILGPIVVRLIFEASMMFVLLVKNVIQINKKLSGKQEGEEVAVPEAPKVSPYKFCGQCGTRYDKNISICPCCGNQQ